MWDKVTILVGDGLWVVGSGGEAWVRQSTVGCVQSARQRNAEQRVQCKCSAVSDVI